MAFRSLLPPPAVRPGSRPHPVVFVLAMVSTVLGTAATATALSALFIAAPGTRIVQNTLSHA